MVADAGDVYLTMYDISRAVLDIERQYDVLLSNGCKVLSMGGDHTITYPILKAYKVC
jgi:guanidinobutyrase